MSKITLKISKPMLYLIVVITTVISVFAGIQFISIYSDYSWKVSTQEQAEAKLNGLVSKVQKVILSIEQIPQNLAYVLEFSNPKNEHMWILLDAVLVNNDELFGACIAFEPNAYDKDSVYYSPYLYKRNGSVVYTDPTDTTYQYFSMDWYLLAKTLKHPVWIEPYFDEGGGAGNIVLASYSVPFYYYDGMNEKFTGVVSVDISLDWLSKMVLSTRLMDGSYTFLVSENGTILSAPNPQWPYNETLYSLAEEHNMPALREIGRNLREGKSGFVNIGKFGKRTNWWIYYKPIPANNWGVLLMVPGE